MSLYTLQALLRENGCEASIAYDGDKPLFVFRQTGVDVVRTEDDWLFSVGQVFLRSVLYKGEQHNLHVAPLHTYGIIRMENHRGRLRMDLLVRAQAKLTELGWGGTLALYDPSPDPCVEAIRRGRLNNSVLDALVWMRENPSKWPDMFVEVEGFNGAKTCEEAVELALKKQNLDEDCSYIIPQDQAHMLPVLEARCPNFAKFVQMSVKATKDVVLTRGRISLFTVFGTTSALNIPAPFDLHEQQAEVIPAAPGDAHQIAGPSRVVQPPQSQQSVHWGWACQFLKDHRTKQPIDEAEAKESYENDHDRQNWPELDANGQVQRLVELHSMSSTERKLLVSPKTIPMTKKAVPFSALVQQCADALGLEHPTEAFANHLAIRIWLTSGKFKMEIADGDVLIKRVRL